MKKLLFLSLIFTALSLSAVTLQENKQQCSLLKVGQKAPDFTAKAAIVDKEETVSLNTLGNTYKVIVFYPADFSFICPTELRALQKNIEKFKERNAQVIGISVDSVFSHLAWLKTPQKESGIQGVTFPIISDITKQISRDYGVLDEKEGVALRGVFILDPKNIVQAVMINNMAIGRNIDEILRLLDAVKHVDDFGEGCPVDWQDGEPGIDIKTEKSKN